MTYLSKEAATIVLHHPRGTTFSGGRGRERRLREEIGLFFCVAKLMIWLHVWHFINNGVGPHPKRRFVPRACRRLYFPASAESFILPPHTLSEGQWIYIWMQHQTTLGAWILSRDFVWIAVAASVVIYSRTISGAAGGKWIWTRVIHCRRLLAPMLDGAVRLSISELLLVPRGRNVSWMRQWMYQGIITGSLSALNGVWNVCGWGVPRPTSPLKFHGLFPFAMIVSDLMDCY
jgi:hypothetical protein